MATNEKPLKPLDEDERDKLSVLGGYIGKHALRIIDQQAKRVRELEERRRLAIEALRDDDDPLEALAILEGSFQIRSR